MTPFQKDRRVTPVYSLAEAAEYLSIPPNTLRAWTGNRQKTGRPGEYYPSVLEFVDRERLRLSFFDLVEAHILRGAIEANASLQQIKKGLKWLKEYYPGDARPLLTLRFKTEGKNLLVGGMLERAEEKDAEALVNVSQHGQLEMTAAIESHLRDIRYGDGNLPDTIFPKRGHKVVSITSGILSGRPTIEGTRIPTSIVAQRHRAGESVGDLSADYRIPTEAIEAALEFEKAA